MKTFTKLMIISLSMLPLTVLADVYFHDGDLKAAYEDARIVLEKPLYDIKQIESDIQNVENILKRSKATSFKIGYGGYHAYCNEYSKDCEISMLWDGELKFYSTNGYVSIHTGTDEAKYKCHKYLPLVLKAAKEEIRKATMD